MDRRLKLQQLLETILGSRNVYFQPPNNIRMNYPCIVYERDRSHVLNADDIKYLLRKRYQVTVIDRDPDSSVPDKVEALRYSTLNTTFVRDNLHHFIFSIHF